MKEYIHLYETDIEHLNALDSIRPTNMPWVSNIKNGIPQDTKYNISNSFANDDYGLDFVDMGLPSGNLWARKNLGASVEADVGDYYRFGEIEPIQVNTLYKFGKFDTYTKYNDDDGLTILEQEDDAAANQLNNEEIVYKGLDYSMYIMPTTEDWRELVQYTDKYSYYVSGEFAGCLFVSKKNNHRLYLPYTSMIYVSNGGKPNKSTVSKSDRIHDANVFLWLTDKSWVYCGQGELESEGFIYAEDGRKQENRQHGYPIRGIRVYPKKRYEKLNVFTPFWAGGGR